MAWTEGVAAFKNFRIMIQRGDKKQEHGIKDVPANAFQATFADGLDQQKAIRLMAYAAALGCRGDKIHILSTHSGKVDLSEADATNVIGLEIGDFQNVPADVQLKVFGALSTFAGPGGSVGGNAMTGISAERKMIGNNALGTAATIELMDDSRFILNDDDAARTAFDVNNPLVTLTPNASDVIVLKPDYIINIDIDTYGS